MSRDTHFELFLRKSPKSSWVLMDANSNRSKAIDQGKSLLKQYPNGGIRVMKEERKHDGSYESIMVISLGDCEDPRKKPSRTFVQKATSSCMSPADLRAPAARKTYIEVMPRFLERHRILPGELIYRTDLLETLEASGSEITQAIQRVAIGRAEGDDLHSIARQLHELVNQAINGMFKDKKNGLFVSYNGSLAGVLEECRRRPNKKIAFGSALADKLRPETTWPGKLKALVAVWREADRLEKNDKDFVCEMLSDYFAEWIATPSALNAIIGECRNTAEALDRLIAILEPRPKDLGQPDRLSNMPAALDLNEAVHLGLLPSAKNTILSRVFEEISSNRRLMDGSLLTEFQTLKKFGDRLVKILQSSRRAEMYEAFCARSKRLMSTDTVDAYLNGFDVFERPRRLLELQDNLVGTDARQKMIMLFRGLIGQPRFEAAALDSNGREVNTLMALKKIQTDLLNSDLPEADRVHAAQDLDALGVKVISSSSVIKTIARKAGSPALAALGLFRLASEAVPKGQCAMLTSMAATRLLKEPDALEAVKSNLDLRTTLKEFSGKARLASEQIVASEA